MKNQMLEIQKILKSEHWQDNLSGLNWSDRLKQALQEKQMRELQITRMENDLAEMKKGAMQIRPQNLCDGSIVAALKSKNNPKISEIGFNTPDDLILNNFGTWLAHLLQGPSQTNVQGYTLYNITNTAKASTIFGYFGTSSYTFNGTPANGIQIQFGSGSTAAARTNYSIQTALGNAPENTRFPSGAGAYANNYVSFGNVIIAGGSGTINEIGLFGFWYWLAGVQDTYMLCRDVLGAGVSYVAGNPLVGTFTLGI
jgi:hypothetical protein